jgi:hypothetical protein
MATKADPVACFLKQTFLLVFFRQIFTAATINTFIDDSKGRNFYNRADWFVEPAGQVLYYSLIRLVSNSEKSGVEPRQQFVVLFTVRQPENESKSHLKKICCDTHFTFLNFS